MKLEENEYGASSGTWLLSFVLGGVIGAAVALLLAPKSGRQTREQIKEMAQEAKEKAEEYYDEARGKFSTAVQKGAEVLQQKKAEMESTIAGVKEAYHKAKETVTAD